MSQNSFTGIRGGNDPQDVSFQQQNVLPVINNAHHQQQQLQYFNHPQHVRARIFCCPAEERTARDLLALPKELREQVWADMSGHPETQHYRMQAETPELIHQQTKAMRKEIANILIHQCDSERITTPNSTANGVQRPTQINSNSENLACSSIPSSTYAAYRLAYKQDPSYIESQSLMFLRAEDFQPKAAAHRILNFFDMKQKLFPQVPLTRDVRWKDLSKDDQESLHAGGIQLLPKTDHAGRAVIVTRQANYKFRQHENLLRAMVYMACRLVRTNENFQKLGFVSVSYQVGGTANARVQYDYELTRKVSQIVQYVPMRFVSIYVCFSATPWKNVADLISHLVSPFLRVRLRSVQGSFQECLYQLMCLGIPHEVFPVNDDGYSQLQYHWRWIQEQCAMEDTEERKQVLR